MSDTTQDAEGANKPMTLAKQVADAQRVVRSWSPDKRANVQLEGGLLNPRSYAAIRQAMGDDAAGVAPAAPVAYGTIAERAAAGKDAGWWDTSGVKGDGNEHR